MIHRTNSGFIERIDSYGHGKNPKSNKYGLRPATIIVDDGDGHFDVWQYTGKREDAFSKISEFLPGELIPHIHGNYLAAVYPESIENTP